MDMKKKITLAVALLLIFPLTVVFAYKFDFVTVNDVVDNVKKKYSGIDNYQADFTIETNKMGDRSTQKGEIKFKKGGRLAVNFTTPYGQKIVSNGELMWIYIPTMNVVAEQTLKDNGSIFSSASDTGIKRLFEKYHFRFAGKDQPETGKDGKKMYTLVLKQKESRSGYRTIKLWISEDYMIYRAQGETSNSKIVDITFSNIRTDIDHPNGIFKFDIPGNARIIKNPMVAEEQ